MTSTSSGGSSVITLQFSLELSLDVAEQEVQAAINAATTFLPRDLPNPPVYSKVNPGGCADPDAGIDVRHLALSQVEDLADTRFAQKISQLSGVGPGQHQWWAAAGRADPGQPDGAVCLRTDAGGSAVVVAAANVNQAKGAFDGPRQRLHHQRQRISCFRARNIGR